MQAWHFAQPWAQHMFLVDEAIRKNNELLQFLMSANLPRIVQHIQMLYKLNEEEKSKQKENSDLLFRNSFLFFWKRNRRSVTSNAVTCL